MGEEEAHWGTAGHNLGREGEAVSSSRARWGSASTPEQASRRAGGPYASSGADLCVRKGLGLQTVLLRLHKDIIMMMA